MTTPTQMPESLKVPEELAAIRELCIGSVEWRCCTEDGAYCMSFDRDNSLNPEREANEWLEKHQRDYPHRFMAYKVRRVVVQSQLQEEALALITRFSALQSALKDRDAEIERLKNDAERWDFVRHHWSNVQMRWNNDETNSLKSITLTVKTAHWSCDADAIESQIDAAIDSMKGDANG